MDIEPFIEQDILVWLDQALDRERSTHEPSENTGAAPLTYITRDFEEELQAALEQQNPAQAKHVLYDLKKQFDEAPAGTTDKKQLKQMLVKLYDEFKAYVEQQQEITKPPEDVIEDAMTADAEPRAIVPQISAAKTAHDTDDHSAWKPPPERPSGPPVAGGTTSSPSTTQSTPSGSTAQPDAPQSPDAAPKQANPAPQIHVQEEQQIMTLLGVAREQLARRDAAMAAQSYQHAKELAHPLPHISSGLLAQFKEVFTQIQAALELKNGPPASGQALPTGTGDTAAPRQPEQSPSPATTARQEPMAMPKPSAASAADWQTLLSLEHEKLVLDELLRKNDLKGSLAQYDRMRTLAQQLSSEAGKETLAKLQHIYSILEQMRQHPQSDERKLMAVP
jgi:hypothetical protein